MPQQQGGFNCRACGEDFNTREQLDEHNKREHPGGRSPGSTPTQ